MKVDFTKLNSANVSADNKVDESRVYDIEARVNIQGQSVNSIDSGIVKKGDVQVATFSSWGESNLNPSFNGVEAVEMCAILMAINEFIADVKAKVIEEPVNI